MKRQFILLLIAIASFLLATTLSAEVPSLISYQGRLTNTAGATVPDTSYSVVFTIYDAASGGTSKWTETQSVTTSAGLFSVMLGSVVPISDTVFSGTTRYLGITVGADPELTPRVALVSVPYAHRVKTVDGATGGTISGNTTLQNDLYISGSVGIGTTTPWDKLHVAGPVRADQFRGPLVVNGGNITYAADGGDHIFTTATLERMRLTLSGNVGIGTVSPADKLEVGEGGNIVLKAATDDPGDIVFRTSTGIEKGRVWSDPAAGSNKLNLRGGSTTTGISIDTAGNVSIGHSIKFPDGSTQTTASPTHYIGESYGGGIVFYVYDNGLHGLIAATSDQSAGVRWSASYTNTCARGDGVGAGLKNTSIIIANQGPVDGNTFAARLCNEYSVTVNGVTYGDWYLPSKLELYLLYLQRSLVGGFAASYYWTSTESMDNRAWEHRFAAGTQYDNLKSSVDRVRAVRAF